MTPSHMEPCQTTRHGRDVSSVGGLGRVVRPTTSNQAVSQRGTPSLSLSLSSSSQPPSLLGKQPAGSKGRRSNGDGQQGKRRRKRGEAKVGHVYLPAVILAFGVPLELNALLANESK